MKMNVFYRCIEYTESSAIYVHLEHVTLNFYRGKCIASTGKCSFIETLLYFVT